MDGRAYNKTGSEQTFYEIMTLASESMDRENWLNFTAESISCMEQNELDDAINGNELKPTSYDRSIDQLTDKILEWHLARKITINGNSLTQTVKLQEEMGELAAAIVRGNKKEAKDAIGDMYVVMCAIAELEGTSIEACISHAYSEIKDRTGHLNEHGNFVRDK